MGQHTPTPLALPVRLGTADGFNASTLFAADDEPLASFYLPLNTTADEMRKLAARSESWAKNLAQADYIIRAVNAHEQLVEALNVARAHLDYTLDGEKFREVSATVNAALKLAGAA